MVITETHIAFFIVCLALFFQTWRKRVYKLRAKRAYQAVDSATTTVRYLTGRIDRMRDRHTTPILKTRSEWPEIIEVKDK